MVSYGIEPTGRWPNRALLDRPQRPDEGPEQRLHPVIVPFGSGKGNEQDAERAGAAGAPQN
jgi:hypothetical protein